METPETVVAVVDNKIPVGANLFDLTKFERVSVEKEIEFIPSKTMADALAKVGNDESKLLEVIQAGERRTAINEARKSLYSDNLVSPKAVSAFVNGFKPLYSFKQLGVKDDKEGRAAQRAAIYGFIRTNPAILEAIRSAAIALSNLPEDESPDNGEES